MRELVKNIKKESVTPKSIDVHIGRRIQLRRNMLGLTQKALADICGVTFQQIQKYESASNRVTASRLFQIGMVLDAPAAFFFLGLPNQHLAAEGESSVEPKRFKVAEPDKTDPLAKNESLELINLYWKLPGDERRTVLNLLKSLNGVASQEPDTKDLK